MKSSVLWQSCVCALVLSACGGSGGSSSPNINTMPTSQNANANNQASVSGSNATVSNTNNQASVSGSNATVTNTNNQASVSGSSTTVPTTNTGTTVVNTTNTNQVAQANFGGVSTKILEGDNDRLLQFGVQSATSGSSLNKIILDGQEITLHEPYRNSNGWTHTEYGDTEQTLYTGYSYMRFGLHESDERNDTDAFRFIAHGQLTDSSKVPTAGKATYTGHALYQHRYSDDPIRGTSQFDVDYGNKKIAGVVSVPYRNDIHLQGDISGNGFAGQLNGTVMQGKFFGNNAEELGGTFHKGSSQQDAEFAGAFGAKK